MFLFGLTWLSAMFTFAIRGAEEVRTFFLAFFSVTGSFQGFFLFIFFCVLDKKVRNEWKYLFFPSLKRKSLLSSACKSSQLTSTTGTNNVRPVYIPELKITLEENNGKMKEHSIDFEHTDISMIEDTNKSMIMEFKDDKDSNENKDNLLARYEETVFCSSESSSIAEDLCEGNSQNN